jgi:hypothetical protein
MTAAQGFQTDHNTAAVSLVRKKVRAERAAVDLSIFEVVQNSTELTG